MCLGYAARVLEVDPAVASALVDDRGRSRRASTVMAGDVAVGDWVLVAAGNVIRRLDPEDAASLSAELARAIASQGGSS
jgi:hydrogenase assembly chaperone HypC/HupF